MFVNYSLEDLNKNNVVLKQKDQQTDLKRIIEYIKLEGLELNSWHLFEIARSEGKRVYGFESFDKNFFYIKMDMKGEVTPHYFKNHGLGGYSIFQAESIKDAIKQYENYYLCC